MNKKFSEEKAGSAVNKKDDRGNECRDDRELIAASGRGDKRAYGELVLKYQKRLYRLVFMMLGRIDATEDIVQDAFVKAYRALDTFEIDKPFYPWIATIGRNLALNYLKKTARETSLAELDDDTAVLADRADNPLDRLIDRENERRFARAVLALPEKYRTVFVLRMFEKLSYDQIARQLDLSPGTVDSRLFRAREKLVAMLKDDL